MACRFELKFRISFIGPHWGSVWSFEPKRLVILRAGEGIDEFINYEWYITETKIK